MEDFNGKIKIQPKSFEDNSKLIEFYFNDSTQDRILFNIKTNVIVFGVRGTSAYISNLLFV